MKAGCFNYMILEIIATLGLTVIFSNNTAIDCNISNAYGCYVIPKKTIILSFSDKNVNKTFYHELAHAIFWGDKQVERIIKCYPPLENYNWYKRHFAHYPNKPGHNVVLQEMVADYFAEFMIDKKGFSVKHPCLYMYFRDVLNGFNKKYNLKYN